VKGWQSATASANRGGGSGDLREGKSEEEPEARSGGQACQDWNADGDPEGA
jgi:hypothetical protein